MSVRRNNKGKIQKPSRSDTLDLYSVAETAAILGVSEKLVFNWIKQGILPAIRLGPGRRLIRIRRIDLEKFINTDFEPSSPLGRGGSIRKTHTEGGRDESEEKRS